MGRTLEDMILDLQRTVTEFWIFSTEVQSTYNPDTRWSCEAKLRSDDGDKVEIKTRKETVLEAVEDVHRRVMKLVGRVPEFDANKVLTYEPAE